jgi:hypothetical protein
MSAAAGRPLWKPFPCRGCLGNDGVGNTTSKNPHPPPPPVEILFKSRPSASMPNKQILRLVSTSPLAASASLCL